MNKKTQVGIGIGVIAIGVFVLALTNPNLGENKDTYFGFIETSSNFDCAKTWDDMMSFTEYSGSNFDPEQSGDMDKVGMELGDGFFKNKCVSKIDDWWYKIKEPTGFNMGMNNPDVREMWHDEEIKRSMEIP